MLRGRGDAHQAHHLELKYAGWQEPQRSANEPESQLTLQAQSPRSRKNGREQLSVTNRQAQPYQNVDSASATPDPELKSVHHIHRSHDYSRRVFLVQISIHFCPATLLSFHHHTGVSLSLKQRGTASSQILSECRLQMSKQLFELQGRLVNDMTVQAKPENLYTLCFQID